MHKSPSRNIHGIINNQTLFYYLKVTAAHNVAIALTNEAVAHLAEKHHRVPSPK